ncbi:hypothetical protein [Psychrobacter sp. UBA2769]|jgi:TetR/AcrR family transcriptional repressor of lmrAB and yxaGH operons|uniref:LmrA/YxaF family transcription factor n=1 Tax=Psychrobacter sp. UBA2769 TaxID=1947348 RepID=UPI0039C8E2A2
MPSLIVRSNIWRKPFTCCYLKEQAPSLAIVFHALTEGGILLALTMKSGKPLETIAEQISSLFIK